MPSARMPQSIDAEPPPIGNPSLATMPPALSASDTLELRRLIPLNTLSDSRFEQICSQIRIEEMPKGSILFRQGDTKAEFVYLLSGTISLQAGGVEMDSIRGGTDTARFALAHQIPRKVSAVARDAVRCVRIEPEIINRQAEPNEGLAVYDVGDVPEETARDWMTALLKSPVVQRLPPANIQAILRSLEEIEVKAGDVICRQGEPGDFYYIIKTGRCVLTRKPSRLAKEIKLTTLRVGDAFGEDSLISGEPRNVTVTMETDGSLLRLDKASFIKLLKDPVISYVDMETAQSMASRSAVWLDVREPDAYGRGHLPGSINIPFFSLRMMLSALDRQSTHFLVCENGRLGEAAAFLLMRYSFEAHVLAGGLGSVPRDRLVADAPNSSPAASPNAADRVAEPEDDETGQTDNFEEARNDAPDEALPALKREIERLKILNRRAIRDRIAAERRAEDLARQVAELSAANAPAAMQARLRDMEEEENRLKEALQSARTRLAVLETAVSAQTADGHKKKPLFGFAASIPVILAITLILTALVLGGLLGTAPGRNFLVGLLADTGQPSLEKTQPEPIPSTPAPGS